MEKKYTERVYELTRAIPYGRVCSYGIMADFLALGSARMVGWALNKSFGAKGSSVPAHRVVNRKGVLSGRLHFPTPTMMQELLENEGIEVQDDQVMGFETKLWDPRLELGEEWTRIIRC